MQLLLGYSSRAISGCHKEQRRSKRIRVPTNPGGSEVLLGSLQRLSEIHPELRESFSPLNQLLRKGEPTNLQEAAGDQKRAFESLKDALSCPPILRLPRPDLPFSVDTDACCDQIGCALLQTYPDNTRHPVGFWSRSLNPAEKNYSTGERECFVAVWAIQVLRPYFERQHFELFTDHQALKWILDLSEAN